MQPYIILSLSALCVAHAGPKDKCLLPEDDLVSSVDPVRTGDTVDLGDMDPHPRPEVNPLERRLSARWPCFDERPQCADYVARGLCFPDEVPSLDLVPPALIVCRHSCGQWLDKYGHGLNEANLRFLGFIGGLGDVVKDPLGYDIEICNLEQGYHIDARNDAVRNYLLANAAYTKVSKNAVRQYTQSGMLLTKVPKGLFKRLRDFYNRHKNDTAMWTAEECASGLARCGEYHDDGLECSFSPKPTQLLLNLPDDIKNDIHNVLLPVAQEWARTRLVPSVCYGIRRYLKGAWLGPHVDRTDTHVISAIINMDQKVNDPWPLDFLDFNGNVHKILLKKRDLLWYESARLPHARVRPFNGEFYDNIFVHFRPPNMDKAHEFAPNFAVEF